MCSELATGLVMEIQNSILSARFIDLYFPFIHPTIAKSANTTKKSNRNVKSKANGSTFCDMAVLFRILNPLLLSYRYSLWNVTLIIFNDSLPLFVLSSCYASGVIIHFQISVSILIISYLLLDRNYRNFS